MKQDATESDEQPSTKPAVLSRERYPALHAILHRYGIPKGTTVSAQRNAREELARLLAEAFRKGYGQGWLDFQQGNVPYRDDACAERFLAGQKDPRE